jgi:hypothetical protein
MPEPVIPPAPEPDDVVVEPGKPRAPTAYEIELRRESQKHRVGKQEAEAKLAAEATRWKTESEAAVAKAISDGNARLMRAELKAEAIKAGLADLEYLKLADISKLKLNDAGDIEGAEAFFVKLKADKPHFFADKSNTSNPLNPPKPDDKSVKKAVDMTDAEYAALRKSFAGK